jgi:hypothetical protein
LPIVTKLCQFEYPLRVSGHLADVVLDAELDHLRAVPDRPTVPMDAFDAPLSAE